MVEDLGAGGTERRQPAEADANKGIRKTVRFHDPPSLHEMDQGKKSSTEVRVSDRLAVTSKCGQDDRRQSWDVIVVENMETW